MLCLEVPYGQINVCLTRMDVSRHDKGYAEGPFHNEFRLDFGPWTRRGSTDGEVPVQIDPVSISSPLKAIVRRQPSYVRIDRKLRRVSIFNSLKGLAALTYNDTTFVSFVSFFVSIGVH